MEPSKDIKTRMQTQNDSSVIYKYHSRVKSTKSDSLLNYASVLTTIRKGRLKDEKCALFFCFNPSLLLNFKVIFNRPKKIQDSLFIIPQMLCHSFYEQPQRGLFLLQVINLHSVVLLLRVRCSLFYTTRDSFC